MKLDKLEIYSLLGLKKPEDFKQEVRFRNAKLIFADFRKMMRHQSDGLYYSQYANKQNGKTTDKIIEAIIAEYNGNDVILINDTASSACRTRQIWLNYRATIIPVYGDPYYYGGRGRVMGKERAQHCRGENLLIIDDCDFNNRNN